MWIFLSIVAVIAIIITIILLLPVYIIVRNDENDNMMIRYKLLFLTFGENSNPNNPVIKAVKKSVGIDIFEKQNLEKNLEDSGTVATARDTCRVLLSLLKEVVAILKYITVNKFDLNIVCVGEDAAKAAISYGTTCSVAYPVVGFINTAMNVKKNAQDVSITCDFDSKEEVLDYHLVISVRIFRLIAAFFRIVFREATYASEQVKKQHNVASDSGRQLDISKSPSPENNQANSHKIKNGQTQQPDRTKNQNKDNNQSL